MHAKYRASRIATSLPTLNGRMINHRQQHLTTKAMTTIAIVCMHAKYRTSRIATSLTTLNGRMENHRCQQHSTRALTTDTNNNDNHNNSTTPKQPKNKQKRRMWPVLTKGDLSRWGTISYRQTNQVHVIPGSNHVRSTRQNGESFSESKNNVVLTGCRCAQPRVNIHAQE